MEPAEPTVLISSISETEAIAQVQNGKGYIRRENGNLCSLWIGDDAAVDLEMGCPTCPMLLNSSGTIETEDFQKALTAMTPIELLRAPEKLSGLLGMFQSGHYLLRALRIRLKAPPVPDDSPIENDVRGKLFWCEPFEIGGKVQAWLFGVPIQRLESLDARRIKEFRKLSATNRGSVLTLGMLVTCRGIIALALTILDGHHKLVASVESGSPVDLLVILDIPESGPRSGDVRLEILKAHLEL